MDKKIIEKINTARYFGMPYGRIFTRSVLSDDPITQKNFGLFMEAVSKKGGVVLDAHPGVVDIFATELMCLLRPEVKRVILPIAASYYYSIFWHHFLKQLKNVFGLYPVYRKEEFGYTDLKVIDFTGASKDQMYQANKTYMNTACKAVHTPGNIIVLALYGGCQIRREWFRSGVIKLISNDVPVLFTISKWEPLQLRFKVYVSGFQVFSKEDLDPDRCHQICAKEFLMLQKQAGVTKNLTKLYKQASYLKVYTAMFNRLMAWVRSKR